MSKVWIEAALNGPWSRARQPGIPDTVETIIAEGVACAKAGACIIHVHAYDGGGPQTFDWRVYARIIEGIRGKIDVPVYPSIESVTLSDYKVRIIGSSQGSGARTRVLIDSTDHQDDWCTVGVSDNIIEASWDGSRREDRPQAGCTKFSHGAALPRCVHSQDIN